MSHFTHVKTRFQNLVYLEKALARLKIVFQKQEKSMANSKSSNLSLVIPQSNGYEIEFAWNGKEYEIIADISFWDQSSPIETFLDKIASQYAEEAILGESQKMGFQSIEYHQNIDGSNTLILERWKN